MSDRKAIERRHHERVRKRLNVRFGPGDLAHNGYTQDVSESGLSLQCSVSYPPNTVLVMQIEYPEKTLTVRGIVRWSKQMPPAFRRSMRGGMGVEFIAGVRGTSIKPPEAAAAPEPAPARTAPSGPPPEVAEKELGRGETRRRQVSTKGGNTFEVLQTEYRGANYVRVYQLPRTDGSAEAVFRRAFWKKEEAEAAVRAFLKDQ